MEMFDKIVFNEELISKLEPKFTKGCKFGGSLTDFLNCDIDIYGDITKGEYTLIQNPIITHSGTFHADEIFSIALIMLTRISYINKKLRKMGYKYAIKFSKHHLINTVFRVPNIDSIDDDVYKQNNAIVIDLIGGHYDHHHANSEDRPTTKDLDFLEKIDEVTPVATFGSIWNAIGYLYNINDKPKLLVDNCIQNVYLDFIKPIDILDCKGPRYIKSPISRVISNLGDYSAYEHNFVSYSSAKKSVKRNSTYLQSNFIEAVMLAYKILRDEISRQQKVLSAVNDVYIYCTFSKIPYETLTGYAAVPVCEMKKLEDEKDTFTINIETLDYVTIDSCGNELSTAYANPAIFINHNPNIRDKSYRFIIRDSTIIRLSDEIIRGDIPGKVFAHPSGFMITFNSDEHLCDFMKNIHCKHVTKLNKDDTDVIIYYKNKEINHE